jgi:endonuclease/exonuclease/phosphatase family metal-dependent hydrolase
MYDALAPWVASNSADVWCLQEVTRTPALGGWTHFSDGERELPQRANFFDDVRSLLPHHQGLFLTSDAGPVVDADGVEHRQDFGIALFVDERIPVIGQESVFVHGSFVDHVQWTTSDRPRIAQAARLVDRESNRTVSVVHLHGLRDAQGKGDTAARRAQADRLVDLVRRAQSQDDLVVVCGDLNLLPDSETFALLRAVGMVDLVGTADTRTSRYQKPLRHASYMLISDVNAVKQFEVVATPEVSDHRALALDI